MAWVWGSLLLASFVAMPFLRPVMGRLLLAPATLRSLALLAGLLTVYAVLIIYLFIQLLLALNGKSGWRLHVDHPVGLLVFVGIMFGFALLLLTPALYLGGANRRAAARFAAAKGLRVQADGGSWPRAGFSEPFTLQTKIPLPGGGFVATALGRFRDRVSMDPGYTYWTLGVSPHPRAAARGLIKNNAKYGRNLEADLETVSTAGCDFAVPTATADAWRSLLRAAAARAPKLFPEILFASLDERGLEVVLSPVLRRQQQYGELLRLMDALAGRAGAGGSP
jgi:hypothetical protein